MIVTILLVSTCMISGSAMLRFTCNNGSSILLSRFCDETLDCDDGSDEIIMSTNVFEREANNKIGCSIQRTSENGVKTSPPCSIHRGYFCNGTVACSGLDPCDVGCPEYYRCNDNRCVRRSTVCDGDPRGGGCREEDGWQSGIGFQCVRNGDICRIPQQLLLDGVQDCDQGEDLCYIAKANNDGRGLFSLNMTAFNQSRCFKCLDRSIIVPRHKVCDGVMDCSDLSDECLCDEEVPDVCQNVIDTETKINNLRTPTTCEVGQVSCENGHCIKRSSVCDSIGDCQDNIDERFSYCRGTLQCKYGKLEDQGTECRCDATHINVVGVVCDGNDDCPVPTLGGMWAEPPGFPADECQAQCSYQPAFNCTNLFQRLPGRTVSIPCLAFVEGSEEESFPRPVQQIFYFGEETCDGILKCTVNGEDEADCPDRFRCPAGRLISIPRSQVCDGIEECEDKTDENNVTCPHRFFCKSRNTKVSIPFRLVCDFSINCDDNSDEINCSLKERFYCENGNPLFVERKQMFDGREDCSDMSDECPITEETRNENPFSSIYHLIANPILRVVVWIMALLALVGNGTVIFGEGRNIFIIWKKKGSFPLKTNLLLIFNLAIADFIMGVYLLMLGIAGVIFNGVFCLHELEWLSSATCTGMGVLVVLSSEASVLTMVVLTSFRLYCVIMPFKAVHHRSTTVIFSLLGIVWFFSLLLALLPLSRDLEYMFTEYAILRDCPFFKNISVSFDSAKTWGSKLLTFDPDLSSSSANETLANVYSARNWKQLRGTLKNSSSSEYLETSSYLGYYSANSVCIPRLFVTKQDKSWHFSLAITIFNFVAFCFVAACYICIFFHQRIKASKNALPLNKENSDKRLQALQGKIVRLVVTDFCCWVPISIMAFIHFSEGNLPPVAYVISAIVLLPINSALNPLLYSGVIDELFAGAKKSVSASQIMPNTPTITQGAKRVVLASETKL